jgi:hypothetical protein
MRTLFFYTIGCLCVAMNLGLTTVMISTTTTTTTKKP